MDQWALSFYHLQPTTVLEQVLFYIQVLKFLSASDDGFTFPGSTDLCGEVISVGSSVTRAAVGDVVCGVMSLNSTYSACADVCDISQLDIGKWSCMVLYHCRVSYCGLYRIDCTILVLLRYKYRIL